MDEIKIIKGEIHSILTILRCEGKINNHDNQNIFSFFVSSSSVDNSLVKSFKSVISEISNFNYFNEIDSLVYIKPFTDVLDNNESSLTLILSALEALQKFILHSFLTNETLSAKESVDQISKSVIDLKVNEESAEIKRILLIKAILINQTKNFLSSKIIVELIKTINFIRFKPWISNLLLSFTEDILIEISVTLFKTLPENGKDEKSAKIDNLNSHVLQKVLESFSRLIYQANLYRETSNVTISTQISSLKIISIILESSSHMIGRHKNLIRVVSDELCKQLLYCSQSKNLRVLSLTLRIVFILFNSLRENLKLQLEVFLTSVHLKICESNKSSEDQREIVLENLVEFVSEPELVIGIFVNFDCQVKCGNLFEEIVKLLCSLSVPRNFSINPKKPDSGISPTQLLATEGIFLIINSIFTLCLKREKELLSNNTEGQNLKEIFGENSAKNTKKSENSLKNSNFFGKELKTSKTEIENMIDRKRRVKRAVVSFNGHGEKSLPYLIKLGILSEPLKSEEIAQFLKNSPDLDKEEICAFLSANNELSKETLKKFMELFDFKQMKIVPALRTFLQSLTLKGESQQILRVLEEFSQRLFSQRPNHFKNSKACYVVVSAIILLNTDLHNEQVKNKMKIEEFSNILKGVNGGENFTSEFINDIYNNIKENQLKTIPNDLRAIVTDNGLNKIYWRYLLATKSEKWKAAMPDDYGFRMFKNLRDNVIHIFGIHLSFSPDFQHFSKIENSIKEYVKMCSVYNSGQHINKLLIILCNTAIDMLEICVSNSSNKQIFITFSNYFRLQNILRLIFKIVLNFGQIYIKESWRNILFIFLFLNSSDLLPKETFVLEDFKSSKVKIPQSPSPIQNSPSKYNLFSSFSSKEKIKNFEDSKLKAHKIIAKFEIDKIFFASYSEECLVELLKVLVSVFTAPNLNSVYNYKACSFIENDSYSIFCIDRVADLIERHSVKVDLLWPIISKKLKELLQNLKKPSGLTERIIVDSLRMLYAFIVNTNKKETVDLIVIEFINIYLTLNESILSVYSDRFTAWIYLVTKINKNFPSTKDGWELYFKLISHSINFKQNIKTIIHILTLLVENSPFYDPKNDKKSNFDENNTKKSNFDEKNTKKSNFDEKNTKKSNFDENNTKKSNFDENRRKNAIFDDKIRKNAIFTENKERSDKAKILLEAELNIESRIVLQVVNFCEAILPIISEKRRYFAIFTNLQIKTVQKGRCLTSLAEIQSFYGKILKMALKMVAFNTKKFNFEVYHDALLVFDLINMTIFEKNYLFLIKSIPSEFENMIKNLILPTMKIIYTLEVFFISNQTTTKIDKIEKNASKNEKIDQNSAKNGKNKKNSTKNDQNSTKNGLKNESKLEIKNSKNDDNITKNDQNLTKNDQNLPKNSKNDRKNSFFAKKGLKRQLLIFFEFLFLNLKLLLKLKNVVEIFEEILVLFEKICSFFSLKSENDKMINIFCENLIKMADLLIENYLINERISIAFYKSFKKFSPKVKSKLKGEKSVKKLLIFSEKEMEKKPVLKKIVIEK